MFAACLPRRQPLDHHALTLSVSSGSIMPYAVAISRLSSAMMGKSIVT